MSRLALFAVTLLAALVTAHAADRDADAERATALELMQARQRIEALDYAAAVELLGAALARTPESADVHSLLGFATRKQGDLDASYGHYRTALRLDPNHRGAHEYLGELYLQRGEPEQARAMLTELERLCPQGCEERSELAKAIASHVPAAPYPPRVRSSP